MKHSDVTHKHLTSSYRATTPSRKKEQKTLKEPALGVLWVQTFNMISAHHLIQHINTENLLTDLNN